MSESVCLDVPYSSEPQRPEILRDDSPWDWEGFKVKKHPDSSNHLQENCMPHFNLAWVSLQRESLVGGREGD